MSENKFAGQVALVTGASRGIGAAIALELVSLLQLVDPQSLFDNEQHATPALGMLLNQLQHRLRQLSDSITLSYFNHAQQHSAWQSF